MTTLTVGRNKQFQTISAAVAASRDGDVVAIDAGTYVNDFAVIGTRITLQGVGGKAHLLATDAPRNGKAILVTDTDVTIDNLEFSGTSVPDGNGAGIRYQAGNLTIANSFFHGNQNGLLANPQPGGSITIRDSEFSRNGAGDGYTHNLYVGQIGTLTISDSHFHDALVGHQIKSRAATTLISNSRISDGADGNGSYSVDLPNGGRAVLTGNVIEQGANSRNPAIVAFGEEGNHYANSRLEMSGNTILNNLVSPSATIVWNATGTPAVLSGNSVGGLSPNQYGSGPVNVTGMTVLSSTAAPAIQAAPVVTAPPAPQAAAEPIVVAPPADAAPEQRIEPPRPEASGSLPAPEALEYASGEDIQPSGEWTAEPEAPAPASSGYASGEDIQLPDWQLPDWWNAEAADETFLFSPASLETGSNKEAPLPDASDEQRPSPSVPDSFEYASSEWTAEPKAPESSEYASGEDIQLPDWWNVEAWGEPFAAGPDAEDHAFAEEMPVPDWWSEEAGAPQDGFLFG